MSDATLRQINGIPIKHNANVNLPTPDYTDNQENDVVMVVDPATLDYDSEYETENERQSENDNEGSADVYESRNVLMCKFCDQAFTDKTECSAHEAAAHNHAVPYSCTDCDMGLVVRLD